MIRRPPRSTPSPYTTLFRSSGATIAGFGSCTFSVTVTGAAAGSYTNTTGSVISANGGTGNTASRAEEHTSAPQSPDYLLGRLLLVKNQTAPPLSTDQPTPPH